DVVRRFLRIKNKVRKLFVLDFDGPHRVLNRWLVDGGNGHDFISSPMDLTARLLYDFYRLYAGHVLGSGAVDCLDSGMGVGAADERAIKQTLGVVIVGVLRAACGFGQSVHAPHAAANIGSFLRRRPAVLILLGHYAPPSADVTLRPAIVVVPALPFGSR